MLRVLLADAAPEVCAEFDTWAVDHGQGWLVPSPWPYGEDDLLTCDQAAEACHVELRTIYRWHQRGLPYVDTPDGIRVRAGDLPAFDRQRRLRRRGAV